MSDDSDARLRRALAVGRMVAWDADFTTGRMTLSETAPEVLGLPTEGVARPGVAFANVHPADREAVAARLLRIHEAGRPESLQFRMIRPDNGEVVWVEARIELLFAPDRRLLGTRGLVMDITARKLAEAARADAELREREAASQWQALVEHAPDIVLRLDRDGAVCFANRVIAPLTHADVLGRRFDEYARPDDRPRIRAIFEAVIASGTPAVFELLRDGGGAVDQWWSSHLGPIVRDGQITGAVLIARDITGRKQTETQLLVADRLASVGTMAAGVAHEINNPLAAVTANLALAQQAAAGFASQPGADELATMLREAGDAAIRVRDVVRDLKLFARAEDERVRAVDVRIPLESTIRMVWNEIRHRAQLVKQLGEVPLVDANDSRLGQVFLNLLINAAQAIPEGRAEHNEIRVVTRVAPTGMVAIDISDTGAGMSEDVRTRLFTPFFTTKAIGVGTGLGLAICQRIVSALGGEIRVRTQLGVGTTFTVLLKPSARVSPPSKPPPIPAPTPAPRRGRVLIVDDEPMVTTVIRRILAAEHEVVIENTASRALARLVAGERFDLILCDLMMPEMTGMDLYDELRRRVPDQLERMTFLTGGAFTARAREFLDGVDNPRIEKPFSASDLRAAVAARLR